MGLLSYVLDKAVIGVGVLVAGLVVYALGTVVYNRYFHPLKNIPGPFWASITTLWYFRAVRYGRGQDYQLPIHKKYGKFVRIAPNQVQIMDATALETIYGPKYQFPKGDFYDNFITNINPKRIDSFSERNEARHTERRRMVAPIYTQGAVLEYEPCVDRVIELFHRQMDRFAASGEVFDMSVWLRKYTFDVIGEMFYGREGGFGFIRDNIDYGQWCYLMDIMPNPIAALNNIPWGFRNLYFLFELLYPETRAGAKGFSTTIKQAHEAMRQRLDDMAAGRPYNPHDTLSKLIDIAHDEKNDFHILDATTEIWAIIWAGSDTTSIALTAIFYFLHKHPHTLAKLRAEVDDAFATGALKYPVRFNDAVKLPYLHAVVLEAMRVHPSLGTGLPRVVPHPGVEISGRFFPGGTGVIMNQNAVHFDRNVFGADAEEFIPERWLRDDDDGGRNAAYMERHMMHFGYGKRICIGRHITNTEMYKLLPVVLRDFDFDLVPDEKGRWEWEVWRGWFHQQKNVMVKARRRSSERE
ncbi:Pisatin demethylase [Cladophialophora carrionii]|uniref:Pisatin demethylase n=1 Tax=Cladophialophora carrionii TaxID=86049 RepID=A0A1C1CFI2_9EURO|nr:Pisatin demethylase [Cladophialophora carrionii]